MKPSSKTISLLAVLLALVFRTGALQAQNTLKTYIFGHSLINHELQVNPTPSNETSVPHWFNFLAQEAGYDYAVSGQYGFLSQHAANLPPIAQWGFDSVPSAWDDQTQQFSEADFDNILFTPSNFEQWQGPSVNYFGDTVSPIQATNTILNWTKAQESTLKFYAYENWPDMGGYLNNGFPPSTSEWTAYNNYLNGGFHDWFLEYHDSLILAHPNHCVSMIPVGPAISHLLDQSPFNQIAIDTLYEDDAPHGRPTIYFLAAMVTYMAMYEEPAPMSYQVPAIIDPIVANNYGTAVTFLWNELLSFNDSLGNSRVFCETPVTSRGSVTPESPALIPYPNPGNGLLRLKGNVSEFSVEVVDLYGKVVFPAQSASGTIDLRFLPSGIYLLRSTHQRTGQQQSRKIVIRK